MRIGVAQIDITPAGPVWLNGYGSRDHRSEGVYQALRAGAVYLEDGDERALILAADVIGYGPAFAAAARASVCQATGLLPQQVVLTATHTHCAPLFSPWAMPGEVESGYAAFLQRQLVLAAAQARGRAADGRVALGRGRSTFGVSRRLPDGQGGVRFAPNPDGPVDRDLDTLWLTSVGGDVLGTLTVYACHATSLGGYLIGGDYPGYLCRALEAQTGAPALFAAGCGADARPWYRREGQQGFPQPALADVEAAGCQMAAQAVAARPRAVAVSPAALRTASGWHRLPYAGLPTAERLAAVASAAADPLKRRWAAAMLELARAGGLPEACPQEVQVVQLGPGLRLVFLAGEVLTEIGLHVKQTLLPATTVVAAYSNGMVAYVPGHKTYPLGGYEVDGSYPYFLLPAPFAAEAEECIVALVQRLVEGLA